MSRDHDPERTRAAPASGAGAADGSDRPSPLAVFRTVVDLPADAQAAALDALPDDVAARVRAMLDADARSSAVVDAEPAEGLIAALARELRRASDPSEPTPDTVGPYEIVGTLGEGGMGIVYLARQTAPQRHVAVKVLRREHRRHHSALFRAEANALAALPHPGIPQVYAIGEDAGVPWMAMEWVRGETLDAWAEHQDGMAVLDAMISVCQAVRVAHDSGLIHRDIKPENVLVTDSGQPKVMDFGLAAAIGDDGAIRGGTSGYAAPESDGAPSPQRDVFALGRVLQAVLPPLPRPHSQDLPHMIARATHPDPAHRYPDAGALGEELARLREGLPVEARAPTLGYRARRFVWRHRAVGRTLLLAALVVATAAAAYQGVLAYRGWAVEARTSEALTRLAPELQRALAEGRPADAEALLRATLQADPGASDTAAAARAWSELATAAEDLGDPATARRALAASYFSEGSDRATAMGRILDHHLLVGDGLAAHRALTQLTDLGGSDAATPTQRSRTASLQRDLGAAAQAAPEDPLTPHFTALAEGARRLPYQAWGVMPVEVDGQRLHLIVDQENDRITLAQEDGSLTEWASAPIPPDTRPGFDLPRPVGGSWLIRRRRDGYIDILDVGCSTPGTLCLEPVAELRAPVPESAVRDGDAVIIGFGPDPLGQWTRQAIRLAADGSVTRASEELYAAGSDVTDLQLTDIDDDGEDELIAAVGPWRAFDVRVLERGSDGDWQSRARARLGTISDVRIAHTPAGPRLVASKADLYRSNEAWPEGQPLGEPSGLYILEMVGDRLAVRQHLPSPVQDGENLQRLRLADLDGDGLEDLAVQLGHDATWFLAGRADGTFVGDRVVSGMIAMGSVQVDEDPAQELIVRLPDDDHHTWILGAGPDAVPTLHVAGAGPTEGVGPVPQALAAAGLVPEAVERVLLEASGLPPRRRAQAEVWAAHHLLALSRPEEAAEALESAARHHPSVAPEALEEAARQWARLNDLDRERQALTRLRAISDDPDLDARIEALNGPAAASRWSRGETVPPELVPVQPLSVQLHPPGTLAIDAASGPGAFLRRAVTWPDGSMEVELSARVDWLEFGAGLGVRLVRDGESVFDSKVVARGGGEYTQLVGSCSGSGLAEPRDGPGPRVDPGAVELQVRIALRANPASGMVRCTVQVGESLSLDHLTPLRPGWEGPLDLELYNPRGGDGRVRAELLSLRTVGLEGSSVRPGPAHAVASGRTRSGLDLEDPVTAAMVAVRSDDIDEAIRLLSQVEARPLKRLPPAVAQSVRQRPERTLEVIRRTHPEWAGAVLRLAYQAVEHPTPDVRALIVHPFVGVSAGQDSVTARRTLSVVEHLIDLGELDRARLLLDRIDEGRPAADVAAEVQVQRARLAAVLGEEDQARRALAEAWSHSADAELLQTLCRLDPLLVDLIEDGP